MKKRILITISLSLYLVGLLLLSFLLYPNGMFAKLEVLCGIGFSFIIFSIFIGFRLWIYRDKSIGEKRVSGLLTPLYSIYLPLAILFLILYTLTVVFFHLYNDNIADYIIIGLVFTFWFFIATKYRKLKMIYLLKDEIVYTDLFSINKCKLNHIKNIKPYMRYLYKIEIKIEDQEFDIIFLPRLRESIFIFSKSKSIEELKSRIIG
ncbi:MAG: hypothetical protein PHV20_07065 [Bacteroidales bacterium]|nr:hypothetical protein [Bacteroidales bacterium]